jgi:hypothetical protein
MLYQRFLSLAVIIYFGVETLVEDKKKKGQKKTGPRKRSSKRPAKKVKKKEDLPGISAKLFGAAGKEAYYLGDLAIHNLEELKHHLDKFTEKEAEWLATWIEYLGDQKTAENIRKALPDFKAIIEKRHKELKKHNKE